MLFTKSIQEKNDKSDGIRICIMRRIKPEFEFDIWMPNLAPSTNLLNEYHQEKIDWGGFEKRYIKEMESQSKYLVIVKDIAKKNNTTILCWELEGENCHRLLVSQFLRNLDPDLQIEEH
jgi:uncharacterized protein YeaO (DUF488 family)